MSVTRAASSAVAGMDTPLSLIDVAVGMANREHQPGRRQTLLSRSIAGQGFTRAWYGATGGMAVANEASLPGP